MTEERLVSLIVRKLSGELDPEAYRELQAWAADDAGNQVLLDRLSDEEGLEKELLQYRGIDPSAGYRRWLAEIEGRRRIRRMRVVGWAAAACLLAAVVVSGLIRHTLSGQSGTPAVAVNKQTILPGRNTATLVLSNGRQILLDSAAAGSLAMDGNARLTKPDSMSLSYQALAGVATPAVAYNTLTTPRSGQYQLTLADGSRVWLNNISSLHFPTAFVGKERIVELSGEGYFEVANVPSKPFIVKVGGESVEVLGTNFNIMAYSEEGGTQTTLLTGAVRVRLGNNSVQLKPDEQARVNANGSLSISRDVNAEDVVSWKNGFFYFGRASFAAVMRQISRWYNIDVVYEGKVPELEFGGKIDRSLTLEELLQYLDKSQVHFRLEGRKLIVLAN
jgi:transmembrane sensor